MKFAAPTLAGALILNGCILPPSDVQTPAGGGNGAASTENRHVFWDGEGAGSTAKGWADCDKKPGCKGTLAPAPGKGKDGTTGLHFHGEGDGWIGVGWNFIGWWPEDGGTDISGHKKLTFAIKVEAESEELAPDLGALLVSLRCSKGKKDSATVSLKNYAPELLDGQWHVLEIPLGEFTKEEFDPTTVWEMNVSTWSNNPKKFDVYLDEIAVER